MKRSSSRPKSFVWIVPLIAVLTFPTFLIVHHNFRTVEHPVPRAAIIDQLGMQYPNPELITELTRQLEQYGFEVTVFGGEDISVDFYRRLPDYGYHLIIFRAHSDLTEDNQETGRTLLYTNEPYSKFKYMQHQLSDRVVPARTDENGDINFAVSSDFISRYSSGNYDGSLIIMMGCASLKIPDMAQAFINKGALAYIGWSSSVTLNHVDETTPVLLDNLLNSGLNIKESLARTIEEKGVDPHHKSFPVYYPYESGNYNLSKNQ